MYHSALCAVHHPYERQIPISALERKKKISREQTKYPLGFQGRLFYLKDKK